MNIILVSINNFQEYIIDNITQLLRLKITNIYIITNKEFFEHFNIYKDAIQLIDIDELDDYYNYSNKSKLDNRFRNGFWMLTSLRFFYIYALMKKYELTDCIHIENDVLLYYDINMLCDKLDKNYMYMPFDTYKRNIASIIYIPDHAIFKNILDNYDVTENDMHNFANIKTKLGLIQNFPIFDSNIANTSEQQFVSENFDKFNMIFDAAAMGQYIGGVDPKNIPGDSTGFVNETCVIKYNKYKFVWENHDEMRKPFLYIGKTKIPIFNLHIHSKNLIKFM
jgi:hypothetical protein